jgi:hypothetical protein
MPRKFEKLLMFTVLFASILFSTGCNMVFDAFLKTPPQPISNAIEIGPSWQELIPPEPLKSRAWVQHVSLRMPESVWRNASWDETDSRLQTLKYADGACGKIEAILFDEKGETYELDIAAIGGGFDLGRMLPPRNPNEPPRNTPNFPTDRVYTKLKIRSDIVLRLDGIEWTGYNPK